jgi:pilus assembly protein CpaF
MNDPAVAEIMINSAKEIYVERQGKVVKVPETFPDEESLRSAVNNVLQYTGKRVSDLHPLIDSRLPDGSRVHVILPPLCRAGTCMTIRKFTRVMFDAEHLIELGSWTEESRDYLDVCVKAEKNILVAGGTSSGKTCLLNVLSHFIPPASRIVTIEDSAELDIQQDHVISLEGRPPDRWGRGQVTIRDLFRSSLRLRPDRIIVGEVRGGEALDMIQAMTSGHAGSMSTLHADTALDALNRLETLALMSKIDLPLYALRSQIASAIDVAVLMARFPDGSRGLTEISEVLPLNADGHYQERRMFEYRLEVKDGLETGRGGLAPTGAQSSFAEEPKIRLLEPHWSRAAPYFARK